MLWISKMLPGITSKTGAGLVRVQSTGSPTTSDRKIAQYNASVELMENQDNALDQQDVTWDYEQDGCGFSEGSIYGQSHDIRSEDRAVQRFRGTDGKSR